MNAWIKKSCERGEYYRPTELYNSACNIWFGFLAIFKSSSRWNSLSFKQFTLCEKLQTSKFACVMYIYVNAIHKVN